MKVSTPTIFQKNKYCIPYNKTINLVTQSNQPISPNLKFLLIMRKQSFSRRHFIGTGMLAAAGLALTSKGALANSLFTKPKPNSKNKRRANRCDHLFVQEHAGQYRTDIAILPGLQYKRHRADG